MIPDERAKPGAATNGKEQPRSVARRRRSHRRDGHGIVSVLAHTTRAQFSMGITGVGKRGQLHLRELLRRDDVVDINSDSIAASRQLFGEAAKSLAQVYGKGEQASTEMLTKEELDAVPTISMHG